MKVRSVKSEYANACLKNRASDQSHGGVDKSFTHPCEIFIFIASISLHMRTEFKRIILIKVYVAEAEGIPEYGTTTTLGKRLVAVKFLLPEASEKEK